jgi:hypothetical protein
MTGAPTMENNSQHSNGLAQPCKLKPYHNKTDTTELRNKTKLRVLEEEINSLEYFELRCIVKQLLL